MNILQECLSSEKRTTYYKVNSDDSSSNNSVASLIADAILQEPQAIQLVARSTENNL